MNILINAGRIDGIRGGEFRANVRLRATHVYMINPVTGERHLVLAEREAAEFEFVNSEDSRTCLSCGASKNPDGTLPCDH